MMGYLLPIQPIQSQQYANRMNIESYNFAYISSVSKSTFNVRLLEDTHDSFKEEQEKKDEMVMENPTVSPLSMASSGFIYPNPANLSPAISQVIGKGISVNVYV